MNANGASTSPATRVSAAYESARSPGGRGERRSATVHPAPGEPELQRGHAEDERAEDPRHRRGVTHPEVLEAGDVDVEHVRRRAVLRPSARHHVHLIEVLQPADDAGDGDE